MSCCKPAATGAVDYMNIPKGVRAKRVGTVDAIAIDNDIDIALFALSALLGYRADEDEPSATAAILAFALAAASVVTG